MESGRGEDLDLVTPLVEESGHLQSARRDLECLQRRRRSDPSSGLARAQDSELIARSVSGPTGRGELGLHPCDARQASASSSQSCKKALRVSPLIVTVVTF